MLGAGTFTLTLIFILIIGQPAEPNSSPEIDFSSCEYLHIAGSPSSRTNLLFFGEREAALDYMGFLFQHPPFNQKDLFNIYFINQEPECTYYKNVALFCYSRELLQKAAACPHDAIVVLKETESDIRASAFQGIASINTRLPKTVLLHELGHVLAGFDEEYLAGYNPGIKSPNCKISCESFPNPGSCFAECSNSNHYRSSENSVMRTLNLPDLTDPFGEHNRIFLSTLFEERTVFLTGRAIDEGYCESQNYILAEGEIKGETITITDADKETGCTASSDVGTLSVTLQQQDGTPVSEFKTDSLRVFTDGQTSSSIGDNLPIDGETFDYEGTIYLAIPDVSGFEKVSFKDEKNIFLGEFFITQQNNQLCPV